MAMSGKAKFLKSAVLLKDYPLHKKNEVAFMGRSNAGKSSLINNLANQKIAKVSQVPGKTRLLNFFEFSKYVLVDMPGYGYASRSGSEMSDWQPMIESYLAEQDKLVGLVLVMDVRRKWSKEETMLVRFCYSFGRPVALALTKTDKCKKTELQKLLVQQKKDSRINNIFLISNTDKKGYVELEDFIYREWIKPADERVLSENVDTEDEDNVGIDDNTRVPTRGHGSTEGF